MRVVLDPNVLVSAAIKHEGTCGLLLDRVVQLQVEVLVCPALLTELQGTLARPKFRRYLGLESLATFLALVRDVATEVPDPEVEVGVTRDPRDDYLVSLARQASADYLVSGDRDLVELGEPEPTVLRPQELLLRLESLDP